MFSFSYNSCIVKQVFHRITHSCKDRYSYLLQCIRLSSWIRIFTCSTPQALRSCQILCPFGQLQVCASMQNTHSNLDYFYYLWTLNGKKEAWSKIMILCESMAKFQLTHVGWVLYPECIDFPLFKNVHWFFLLLLFYFNSFILSFSVFKIRNFPKVTCLFENIWLYRCKKKSCDYAAWSKWYCSAFSPVDWKIMIHQWTKKKARNKSVLLCLEKKEK